MKLMIHTTDTAPDDSRSLLDGIATDLGFIPNLAAVTAGSPTLLAAFDALRRVVAAGSLEPTCREIAGLATGVAVDNAYGVAFHSTVLGRLAMPEPEIARMRAGEPPHDPRGAAIYTLAQDVVRHRGKVDDATIDQATAAGLSTTEILEVVAECTFASLVGLVDNLAQRVELDPFLQPMAWTP